MTRIERARHVAADPAGVALLLAEPASWADGDNLWEVAAPQRMGTRFSAALEIIEPNGRLARGIVTVCSATEVGSEIRVAVNVQDHDFARAVERSASTFLEMVADRAQARAFAA
jgi:hypothetical protein